MSSILKNTLFSILKKASLSEKTLSRFTTPKATNLFQQSLTTRDYGSDNYETLEARGDAMVNEIATIYVLNRYPKVRSLKWKAKLQQNILGTKSLAFVCDILGLTPFIRSKEVIVNTVKEDVVESFVGVIGTICGDNISAYYAISYSILSWCFDKSPNINLNHAEQFDPLSRFKETHDAYALEFKKGRVDRLPSGEYKKTFVIPTKSPRTVFGIGQTELSATHNASLLGLKILEEEGYKEKVPNPFEVFLRPAKEAVELTSLPPLPPHFEKTVMKYFANTKQEVRDVLELNLESLFKCFFDSKYFIGVNAADEKFVGVSVVDLIAVEYIFNFESNLSPKKVTTLKHSLAHGNVYVNALGDLSQFVQLPPSIREEDKIEATKACFKAFVGCSFEILNKEFGEGAGLAVWRTILFSYIKQTPPSATFIQPKTILSKHCKNKWRIDAKELEERVIGDAKQTGWKVVIFVEGKKVSELEGYDKKKIITNKAIEMAVNKLGLK